MSELLQNADPVQLVIIAIGFLMVAPTALSFVMGLFGKSQPAAKATPLSSLIQKWEALNQACVDAELVEAQEKLREVFFLLVPKPVSPTDTEE